MKTNKKFWISVSIGALISGAILSYPKILRWQVEKRLQGVEFTDVNLELLPFTLTLSDVTVSTPPEIHPLSKVTPVRVTPEVDRVTSVN